MDESKHCSRVVVSLAVAVLFLGGLMTALPAKAIDLPADSWIRGNVSDMDGPVPDSYVKVMMFTAGGADINWTMTDESGDYEIGVPGGYDYMVLVANGSYLMAMNMVSLLEGETAWANFTLEPIAPTVADVTIKGYVEDSEGMPVSEGHVLGVAFEAMGGDMPYYANVTVPDGDGYFEVNIIAGTGGGGAVAMDFAGYPLTENVTESELTGGETYWFNITLESPSYSDNAMVHGLVTVSGSSLPLESVLVAVEVWDEETEEGYSNYTFTDEDGYYELNVTNGSARIMITKGGYTMAMFELEISAGETIERNAELTPTDCVVQGNVTNGKTMAPIGFVTVFMWYGPEEFSIATTDGSGFYKMRAVAGEDRMMLVQLDNYSRGFVEIDLMPGDEKWQDFELWPVTAWIEGVVTDFFTGDPIENARVHTDSMYFYEEDLTNSSGYYRLDVPPGTYEVRVERWDYRENVSYVEALDETGTTHDVEMLPWILPEDRMLHGWVNDSVSGTGIHDARVVVQLLDGTYRNEAVSDWDGYYEMYIPAVEVEYLVTAYQHYPAYGMLDATPSVDPRKDFLLDRDLYPPNMTYQHDPVENITWFNPTVIDAEIEEPNLENIALMIWTSWKVEGVLEYYYAIDMKSTSLNPLDPRDDLHPDVVGDNYTVHIEWNATIASAGWLDDGSESHYVVAQEQYWGPLSYYVMWGQYSNDTLTDAPSTAYFDSDTGELLWVWLDGMDHEIYPGDPTATFAVGVSIIAFNTTYWSGWPEVWEGAVLAPVSVDDAKYVPDETVPSGQYMTLFGVSDFGGGGDFRFTNVTVDNDPPVADAGSDRTEVVNTTIELNASLSSDNGWIVSYVWEFEDDGAQVFTDEVVTYMFTLAGSYAVNLTVTDGAGHQDTDMIWIHVADDMPPVADAGEDFAVDEGAEAVFDGSGSTDDVEVVNYTWTVVHDSVELYGVAPTYVFDVPGVYEVTLVVRDNLGHESEPDSVNVTVEDITAPVANAGLDLTAFLGSAVPLDGSLSSDNVGVVNYTWTFTDDGEVEIWGETPSYVFSSLGEYVVTLTVRDAAGNTDTDEVVVTIVDGTDPVANAGPDQIVAVDEEVTFDGSDSSDNVGIVSYTWTFNDGTNDVTKDGVSPVHTFDEYGAYVVTLTVEDAAGNSDTDTVTIRVNAPPVADAGSDVTVSAGETVTFNASDSTDDSGDIESYVWTFTYDGQERQLTGESPTFTFEIAGVYIVTLEVTDAGGLTDTDTMTVTVEEDDGDGTADEKSFLEEYWWVLLAIAVIVVAVVVLTAVMKSGKGKGESEAGGDSDEEMPPPPEDEPL